MIALNGTGISPGIASGTLILYNPNTPHIPRYRTEDVTHETERIRSAIDTACEEIDKLIETATEDGQMLLETHRLMLFDVDFTDRIMDLMVNEHRNAEDAVFTASAEFARAFSEMDDPYMQARSADIKDISNRLLEILSGEEATKLVLTTPSIIVAEDLTPSETIGLDTSMVLGFVLTHGNANSHTAILARALGVPAIINVNGEIPPAYDGKQMVMDGSVGYMVIDPDRATMEYMSKKRGEEQKITEALNQLRGKSDVTLDGKTIKVYANIAHPNDIDGVLKNDARGIGLFRSEFLYLNCNTYPDENFQYSAYRSVVEAMAGSRVIIRTVDIGADKKIGYFNLKDEENPALGLRGLRVCLTRPDIFKTQLRALMRASVYGKLSIMLPMVSSLWEVQEVKRMLTLVKKELTNEGTDFDPSVELGIMIETPASVMIAEELAKEVDFFSIGTNDLTQYTIAVDRQGVTGLEKFYDAHHPAVMKMIKMTVDAAHRNNIWAGICGEIAADPTLTEAFLKMGVDELSVSPNAILKIRNAVRHTDLSI